MTRFISWPSNSSISVESSLVVFPIDLSLSLPSVDIKNLLKIDDSLIIMIKFRDQFAQLKFLKMQLQSLHSSLEVIDGNMSMVILVKILDSLPAKTYILLIQYVFHFFYCYIIAIIEAKTIVCKEHLNINNIFDPKLSKT